VAGFPISSSTATQLAANFRPLIEHRPSTHIRTMTRTDDWATEKRRCRFVIVLALCFFFDRKHPLEVSSICTT
jgi:hypothetical protein